MIRLDLLGKVTFKQRLEGIETETFRDMDSSKGFQAQGKHPEAGGRLVCWRKGKADKASVAGDKRARELGRGGGVITGGE